MTECLSNVWVQEAGPGITEMTLRPSGSITIEDCVRACSERLALTGGEPGPMLLKITGVGSVSREAVSGYGDGATLTALAVLGRTPVDRVIANAILRRLPISCPARYFTSEENALDWLQAAV